VKHSPLDGCAKPLIDNDDAGCAIIARVLARDAPLAGYLAVALRIEAGQLLVEACDEVLDPL